MRDIQKVMGALRSPIRREILTLVWDRELAAGEIASAFPLSPPSISQHLGVLREAELVSMTQVGTSRRYRARREVLLGLRAALAGSDKWQNADDAPERALTDVFTVPAVVASVDVETSQEPTFRAFTDATVYSRWLGVPVTLEEGRFACTMEWGTQVRGRYELVAPPELIVMRWDFEDDNIPVPGGELTGYLRVSSKESGSHVEVHQLVDTPAQAEFMQGAWAMVLGRLRAGVVKALDQTVEVAARPRRPKRRRSA